MADSAALQIMAVTLGPYGGAMAWELEAGGRVTDFRELPTPGAVQYWEHEWVPTLDREPILRSHSEDLRFQTREAAWAEAIKLVKHRAGLAIEMRLGSASGCLLDEWTVIVETVAEAREAIVRHVLSNLQGHEGGSGTGGPGRRSSPGWEDLAEYERGRHYDPGSPEDGLRCWYSRSEVEWVEGVGGTRWPVSHDIWAIGPPEVWDHPADQPAGLDNDDDRDNDLLDD